jgi:hypothetical protein
VLSIAANVVVRANTIKPAGAIRATSVCCPCAAAGGCGGGSPCRRQWLCSALESLASVEVAVFLFFEPGGPRPVYHHKEERTEGHLFIAVLAYQLVQAIRRKLEAGGETMSWTRLREILSVQRRIMDAFRYRNGHTMHVREAIVAEPALRRIYDALEIDASPGGIQRLMRDNAKSGCTQRRRAVEQLGSGDVFVIAVNEPGKLASCSARPEQLFDPAMTPMTPIVRLDSAE